MKKSGILVPVASLPNRYGIGDFGPQTYEFIDELKNLGVHYWQILPLNRLSYGNSPYQPLSSFAIDEIYISLDMLEKEHLIKKPSRYHELSKRICFWKVRENKEKYLKEAYKAFKNKDKKGIQQFIRNNKWVLDYAYFIALKKHNGLKQWSSWELLASRLALKDQINYEIFLQYIAFKEWKNLHNYAKKCGIEIIGDMPFYVGYDSSDVYFNRDSFLLDENNLPKLVAGVPPDYFSKTGQLWGNPIYNFMKMRESGYAFYINRIKFSLKMYDVLRIDHFRAFDSYYVIPYGREDAVVGEWWDGPNYDFFDYLKKKVSLKNIIAEDLGDLRPSVLTLRDHYNLPGMQVIEFTINDPKFITRSNMVAYTGTHDNDTIKNWYRSLLSKDRSSVNSKVKTKAINGDVLDKLILYTLKSKPKMAIIPLQDVMKLGKFARLNVPGTVNDINWSWRLVKYDYLKPFLPLFKESLQKAKRIKK